MSTLATYQESFNVQPTALLEFFEVFYDRQNPSASYTIHGGANGINSAIVWQGRSYNPIPITASGFEVNGDGTLPRPKLKIYNKDFFISGLCRSHNNLLNAKVIRRRVYTRFLDDINFQEGTNPYGMADPNAGIPDEIFFISRKIEENREYVNFELVTALELENINFPGRTILSRYCPFNYRGNGCRYIGKPVADELNKTFTSNYGLTLVNRGVWSVDYGTYNVGDYVYQNSSIFIQESVDNISRTPIKDYFVCMESHTSSNSNNPSYNTKLWKMDSCSRSISGCNLRFGKNQDIPFGGFAGTSSYGRFGNQ